MDKQNPFPQKLKIATFIDPLQDFGFKFLFGREPAKELLIDFLNELFKGRKVITNLTYNKNERSGPRSKFLFSIFSPKCVKNPTFCTKSISESCFQSVIYLLLFEHNFNQI